MCSVPWGCFWFPYTRIPPTSCSATASIGLLGLVQARDTTTSFWIIMPLLLLLDFLILESSFGSFLCESAISLSILNGFFPEPFLFGCLHLSKRLSYQSTWPTPVSRSHVNAMELHWVRAMWQAKRSWTSSPGTVHMEGCDSSSAAHEIRGCWTDQKLTHLWSFFSQVVNRLFLTIVTARFIALRCCLRVIRRCGRAFGGRFHNLGKPKAKQYAPKSVARWNGTCGMRDSSCNCLY